MDLIADLEAKDWIDLSAIDADAVARRRPGVHGGGGLQRRGGRGADPLQQRPDVTRIDLNTDADADVEASIRIAGEHTDHANLVL